MTESLGYRQQCVYFAGTMIGIEWTSSPITARKCLSLYCEGGAAMLYFL